MTQLLISVKNLTETQLALNLGVDIIDLKDPAVGALGALDLALTAQIVRLVNAQTLTSATVGEQHDTLDSLIKAIEMRAALGVDIIKLALSDLFDDVFFVPRMRDLTQLGIKLVAVMFADEKTDLNRLEHLKQAGFYGAMLDTKHKQKSLVNVIGLLDLQLFTQQCQLHQLQSGLAGSLQAKDIAEISPAGANYLGFRGGACDNYLRQQSLCPQKVAELKTMLLESNKVSKKHLNIKQIALHN